MNLQDVLLAFSEWLDSEGLIVSDQEGDDRTHEALAATFIRTHHAANEEADQ